MFLMQSLLKNRFFTSKNRLRMIVSIEHIIQKTPFRIQGIYQCFFFTPSTAFYLFFTGDGLFDVGEIFWLFINDSLKRVSKKKASRKARQDFRKTRKG